MEHPPVADILAHVAGASAPGVAHHLEACAACRSLAGIGDALGEPPLVDLVTVDPSLYGRREAIRDEQSGMGRAFRARDRRLGREVVIKQIRPSDPATAAVLRERFAREARLTARLQHPGIVGVHELGRWPDGEPFYTMPLVEGQPLDEAIAAAPTATARLALLPRLAAAADAIAYAHECGVIHRDIKPANILLGRFGETQVIDWGLAKAVGEPTDEPAASAPIPDDGLTRAGAGTAAYMPPEQARGEPPDRRVDVYALGATLYHLLAGTPPYGRGDADEIRRRLAAGPPRPLRELAPHAPAELIAIVDKAMERDREVRFASALELAEELRRFAAGQLTRTHQYSPSELLRHFLQRHRAALRIGLVALAIVVVVTAISVARVVRERDRARTAQTRAEANELAARSALAQSRAARARMLAGTPTGRIEALELVGAAAADAPDDVWPILVDVTGAGRAARPLPGDPVRFAVWAPDGTRIATISGDAQIQLRDAAGDVRQTYRTIVTSPQWLVWAPDGTRLIVIGIDERVEVLETATGAGIPITSGRLAGDSVVAFRDDGALVTASATGLRAWDIVSGGLRATAQSCSATRIAVDGQLVAVACDDGALIAWDGERSVRWRGHGDKAEVWSSPADGLLLSAGFDGKAHAWSLAAIRAHLAGGPAASPRTLRDQPGTRMYAAIPSPAGGWVAVATGTAELVWLADGRRSPNPYLAPEIKPPTGATRVLASESGRDVLALDAVTGEVVARLVGHQKFSKAQLTATRDGSRALVLTTSGEIWLWDARTGVAAGHLPTHDAEIVALVHAGERVLTASIDGLVRAVALDGTVSATTRTTAEITATAIAGDRLVTGHHDGTIREWYVDGTLAATYQLGQSPVSAVAMGPRGTLVAGDLDGEVALWSSDASPRQRARAPHAVTAIATDGSAIVSGHRDGLRWWSRDRAPDFTPGAAVTTLVWRDTLLVSTTRDDDSIVLATPAASERERLAGRVIIWSPAGDAVLVDGGGRLAVRQGTSERVLAEQGPAVTAATLSHDGRMLYTAHVTGEIRVWNLDQGTLAWSLEAPELGPATAVALSRDGRWLLVGHASGDVRAHPLSPEAARERVCTTLQMFGRHHHVPACISVQRSPTTR